MASWLLAATAMTAAGSARAEPPRWQDHWGEAQAAEYAAAISAGALAAYIHFLPVMEHDWGRSEPDLAVRGVLRLQTPGARRRAGEVSNVLFYGLMLQPIVDGLVTLARDERAGWQVLVLDGEVLALAALSGATLQHVSGRARPFASHCREPVSAEYAQDCRASAPDESHQSFPSGHVLYSAAGAGLTCAHHGALPVYGGGAPDAAACIAAVTGAVAQGALRLMSDRHWTSDVVVSLVLGFGIGYGLPQLRYGNDPPPPRAAGTGLRLPLYATPF